MRQSPKYERARDALPVVLVALVFLACTGCIMVPIPSDRHTHDSRRAIPDSEIAALIPGETTLTQVLLRFGEPDYVYSDDSLIGYNWQKISSELWIFGEWFGKDDGFHRYKHGQEHNLDLTFDAQEKLLQHNLRHTTFEDHTK